MTTRQKKQSYEEKLRAIVEAEATKKIADAPMLINSLIQRSLLSLLGLEDNGHRGVEIDHCNSRNSVLIDAFRNHAKAEAEKIAKNYKPSKDSIARYQDAFEKEFNNRLFDEIRTAAREQAKTEAARLVETIKIDVTKILAEQL